MVELLAIEAGRRSPTPSEVESLLALYQCTLDQILPPRLSLDPSLVPGLSDRSVLGQYLNLVREWRNVDNLSGIRFRPDDLAVLVGIVGTDASEIERKLIALTGCTKSTARQFRHIFLVSLAALPVGLAGAALAATSAASAAATPAATAPSLQTAETSAARTPARVSSISVTRATQVGSTAPRPTAEIPAQPPTGSPATAAARNVPLVAATAGRVIQPAPARISAEQPEATLSIPKLDIDLPVVAGGQSIVDEGVVAHFLAPGWLAPIAAGGVVTYWLAAHHLTHGAPFDRLPEMRPGDLIRVTSRGRPFVYTVTSTEVVGIFAGYTPVYGPDLTAHTVLVPNLPRQHPPPPRTRHPHSPDITTGHVARHRHDRRREPPTLAVGRTTLVTYPK